MSQTKYEILQAYKLAGQANRIRDTWVNLGGSLIGPSSRAFIKDMIYKIQIGSANADLEGALVLCESPLYSTTPLNWAEAVTEDADEGFFSFSEGIISPHFRLLLKGTEVAAVVEPVDPAFIPYEELTTAEIEIPDSELELILVEAGVPFILMEELEFPRHKIVNLMVKPALQEYFKYFPIIKVAQEHVTTAIGSTFELELPQGAYGATRAFILQGAYGNTGPIGGNPMFWAAAGNGNGAGWGANGFGAKNGIPGFSNLQGFTVMSMDRAARQGMINQSTTVHFKIEHRGNKKFLVGHSNKAGTVEVHWAFASNNWSDIEYARLNETRSLATAKVLRALGMLRSQVKSDIPGQLDFGGFITRAKELEDGVLEFWKSIPRTVAMRGGL